MPIYASRMIEKYFTPVILSVRSFGPFALISIAAGAALVLLPSGSWSAAAGCGMTGLFAVALMRDLTRSGTGAREIPPPTTAKPPEPPDQPVPAALIGPLLDPALIVAAGRVAFANRAAVALLGDHVIGEEGGIAIRPPAGTAHVFG